MVCDPCKYFLSGITREIIEVKVEVLETRLLRDKLCKKVYVACSFLFGVRMIEPRVIKGKVKIDYRVDIGAEKGLENELINILISIFIQTELLHV